MVRLAGGPSLPILASARRPDRGGGPWPRLRLLGGLVVVLGDVFAGGQTSVQLDDGTVLSQSAPTGSFTPASPADASGPIPVASSAADLQSCGACAYDDPASRVWSVAVQTAGDTITAGPLTLSVSGASSVKRFLFNVRH